MIDLVKTVFALDVTVSLLLVAGSVWSIAVPKRRIWPPPGERSWQYVLTWTCFDMAFLGNAALFVLDWDSWFLHGDFRFFLGVPLAAVGASLVSWGVATLGVRNTSGLPKRFVRKGPYRFTRNPQYLGDIALFLGLSVIANSLDLWITHALLILVFLMIPRAEEAWLKEQYGEVYEAYRKETRRFL